ncbi:plasmid pRiA4b ORF-3 family protein [Streptomyces himalayensis]|uniref:Plasmid pRiA4b ORF-3 family protein n=1 Tax=Streptomyces himalayensis subsp. himalayensis TaxID=2756131 RepID=A0A7W0DJ71_9ACTN|nr:plasmid pRiA4b ORF-3 family protein [Streptomyces himalayensis]MBA2945658.1 plasmid pRiA4b ORF-3 family protein [Streptomyces himalayensis subsp. himalayensis]
MGSPQAMAAQRSSAEHIPSVHQLKVGLEGVKPPVWRRLVVPSDITLGSLHDVIQVAFGWENMHLHAFEDRSGGRYAPPEDASVPVFDEEEAALVDVLPRTGDRMDYTYDFGDDWLHRIAVEAVHPAEEGDGERALCIGGRRAMPPAEDLGGVWGLAELLERYEDGERPIPTVVRHGGEEWAEYDSLRDEVLVGLYEEGFDPAAFDPAELTRELTQVPLRRAAGTRRKGCGEAGGRQAPPRTYRCECGSLHPLPGGAVPLTDGDGVGEQASLSDVLDESLSDLFDAADIRLPAVRLPGEAELARAVREGPAFMAAVRLGHWCGGERRARRASAEGRWRETGGRELTPKGLLRPKLARQAVEEAELWRIDPEEWGDPEGRAARLAKIRSAADMELVDLPWEWALSCGFVKVDANRAHAGDELPDQDDDAALLAAWQGAAAGAAIELSLNFPALDGPLGGVAPLRALTDEVPPLVFLMLLAAYGLPDGEWLNVADYFTGGLEGLPEGPARRLVSALLVDQYHDTAGTLELFGAAEREGHEPPLDASLTLLFDGGGPSTLPAGRFRLTPLGRSGLRALLVQVGVPAPVIGSLAQADARDLLTALASYPSETDAAAEVEGWLAARSTADAAVQVVDACDGTEPADALRRLQAPRVLAAVLEADRTGRVKAVLRKAAVSQVTGCAHAAASMLRRIGEPAEGQAPWGLEWMLVDGALPFAKAGEQALRERLLAGPEDGKRPLDQVAERADDLWRAGHPHAGEVLGALADAVKPLDKALAKRLRKAAFKAGSAA